MASTIVKRHRTVKRKPFALRVPTGIPFISGGLIMDRFEIYL